MININSFKSFNNDIQPVSKFVFIWLILFFIFEYLRPGLDYPVIDRIRLNTIIPLTVLFLTIFSSKGNSNQQVFSAISTKWFLFFIFLFIIQFIAADVRQYVYDTFKAVIGYLFIYYVIMRHVADIKKIKIIFFILLAIHVWLIFKHPNIILQPEARHYLAGTFLSDGNDFAWSVCIIISFALFLAQSSDKITYKVFFYGVFVFLILAVIGTQSRGASLALGFSIIYLVMNSRKKIWGLCGIGFLIIIIFLFAPQAYFDRMNTLRDYETEGSAQGRIMAWKAATNMALDKPLTGVGPGHYSVMFGAKYKPRDYVGPYLNTHSIYFLMLGEFGIPGIIFLLGITISNLYRNNKIIHLLKKNEKYNTIHLNLILATQTSFIAYLIAGAFLSGIYYPHLFVLTALMECVRLIILNQYGKGVSL